MIQIPDRLKGFAKSAFFIYPLIIIISIPLLMVLNTIWNLRSFNRDVNFLIRHQAVGVADTLKPVVEQKLNEPHELNSLLFSTTRANPDIILVAVIKKVDDGFEIVASNTSPEDASDATRQGINQLAIGFNQPFAGLSYDPNFGKNVWNVVVPLELESEDDYLMFIKLETGVVDTILDRTSRDSLVILTILIAVTLILLANHFIFYKKAVKAQQLAELDKLKDEFFSMASHELRTPVTAMIGYLELLRGKVSPGEFPKLKEDLGILDSITSDLRDLINDLLDISRIEQHRIKISASDVQVNKIITKVISTLYPLAKEKGLIIKFTPTNLPIIKSDADRIRQVITNLAGNSIKYTLQGEILIIAEIKDKFIKVTVKDTGIGIPAEHLPKLFGKFHRVKDRQSKDVRGTGLGLWITRQIVELLGGKIHAESIHGTGTSITFTLPIVTT